MHILYICTYIYIHTYKLATVLEGDLKAPFSIATAMRCRGGLHFTLDTNLIILSAKQGGIKYHFLKVFSKTWPGIEPWFPGPLVNTLPTGSIHTFTYTYLYMYIYKFVCVCLCVYVCVFTNLSTISRLQHEVSFKLKCNRFKFKVFLYLDCLLYQG